MSRDDRGGVGLGVGGGAGPDLGVGAVSRLEAGSVTSSVRWERVDGRWLRLLRFAPGPGLRGASPGAGASQGARGAVLLVPGLGLPRYLLPLARHLAAQGVEVLVLDALAWRGRGGRAVPTIAGLSEVTAAWLRRRPDGPLVVVGHSTGAQVALEAVVAVQGTRPPVALVMAGPTFTPEQRRLRGLIPAALTAYRKDTPKELVVVKDLARVRTDVVRIVQSGRRHPVEKRVGLLTVPLTLTAGEADSFAPREWLDLVARRAGAASRVVVLPGSHNNPYTCPDEFSSVVRSAEDDPSAW